MLSSSLFTQFAGGDLSSRCRADGGTEVEFYAREAFQSRDGFTFLVAGRYLSDCSFELKYTNVFLSLPVHTILYILMLLVRILMLNRH